MSIFRGAIALSLSFAITVPALAKKTELQAVPAGAETARFDKGIPTLDLALPGGAVQVRTLPMDHGSYSFGLAIFNMADKPANFALSNITVTANGVPVALLPLETLEKKAKSRAMWTQIAIGVAGGLSAAALANQRDTYRSTYVTPHGVYQGFYSAPSASGQIAGAATAAATGYAIVNIQNRLDDTLARMGDNIIQLTTVDAGESYGGVIVLSKIKDKTVPLDIALTVRWNGQEYPFKFRVVDKGTPSPEFTNLTVFPENPPPAVVDAGSSPADAVAVIKDAAAPTGEKVSGHSPT